MKEKKCKNFRHQANKKKQRGWFGGERGVDTKYKHIRQCGSKWLKSQRPLIIVCKL